MIDADLETAEGIASEASSKRTTMQIATMSGDISGLFDASELAALGADVVRDYEIDDASRAVWKAKAKAALEDASQEAERDVKNYPFAGASDVKYPLLTVAAMQFQARAYPAIFKGDEVVQIKVVGSDKGRVRLGADGQPEVGPDGAPIMEKPAGTKTARAQRVRDYMNVCIAYRMDNWEADTDLLLLQLLLLPVFLRL